MFRRKCFKSLTFHAPSPGRSLNSPCAMSSMAGQLRTRRRWPIRKRSIFTPILPRSKRKIFLHAARVAKRAGEEDHRDESGGNDSEGRQSALFELIERSESKDARRQSFKVKRPQDQCRWKLLHAVDEDEETCRDQRGPQDR